MKKTIILSAAVFAYCILHTTCSFSQGAAINSTGAKADSSALLDLSSTSKGILIPRMTTAEMNAIVSPATGLIIFNTTCGCINYYSGSVWKDLCGVCNPPATPGGITGNSLVCKNTSGEIYSISPVTNATSYTWTVPSGASITAGQGTTSITVTFGTVSGDVCVTADNACGASSARCLAITIPSGGNQNFTASGGGYFSFVVPTCVSSIVAEAYGAQGGGNGGLGGYATATIPVTAGETLSVYVGGQGYSCADCPTGGGFNGGGGRVGGTGGTYSGCTGGGASDIRRGTGLSDRLIVAAGGGGEGYYSYIGGAGGGATGGDGTAYAFCGGLGATQSAGGLACNDGGQCPSNTNGSLGQGGIGQGANAGGGGGGGGYYGGGGGCNGGGGGGSSWTNASGNTNQNTISGVRSGDGRVVISW